MGDNGRRHVTDGLVVLWVVVWAVIGTWTGVTIWRLADTGDTITNSGDALVSVGGGLEGLAGVPVIGDRPAQIGAKVKHTGGDISDRGQEIKGQMHRLGLLLGIAIVGIPSAPVLGLYLPLRIAGRRERRDVEAQLRRHPEDDDFDRWLADRARAHLRYVDVVEAERAAPGPRGLADAELVRLGISRPPQR